MANFVPLSYPLIFHLFWYKIDQNSSSGQDLEMVRPILKTRRYGPHDYNEKSHFYASSEFQISQGYSPLTTVIGELMMQ